MSVLGSSGETGTKGRYWSVSNKGGLEGLSTWKKPAGLKIVAMIFYGRPATVSILDCYLKVGYAVWNGLMNVIDSNREISSRMVACWTKSSG